MGEPINDSMSKSRVSDNDEFVNKTEEAVKNPTHGIDLNFGDVPY